MANKKRNGNDCKAYRNSGTYNSPTWNEVQNLGDLSLPATKSRGEFRTRGSKFVKRKGAKIDVPINATYVYDPGDDDFDVLHGSFWDNEVIDMAIVDGPIATPGTQGLRADIEVMDFPIDQPLESGVSVALVMEPTISDNEPTWMVVPTP